MVRIGMVGARFGATVHLQNLAPLRGTRVQLTGICSQSRESAEACARRFDIPFVTTDLAALLDMTSPAVSHHLRILRTLRLVKVRRRGRMAYYSLDDAHIERLFRMGLEHVEEG
ncbi:MAG: metalloregulator ArsR/SmtB family transcription factor [candidate division NC10 bacterium]